jgi:magnesium transporter
MPKLIKPQSPKAGLVPGTLVYLGDKKVDKVSIQIMDYDAESLKEVSVTRPEKCEEYLDKDTVTWIHVAGLHEIGIIEKFGKMLKIHDLVLEDVLNTAQRPKFEDHENLIFVVVKMLHWVAEEDDVVAEHVAVLLGPGYVLTFQETDSDIFGDVRERIRTTTGRARSVGADYLAYALIDAIMDQYYVVLENVDDRVEVIHESVTTNANTDTLKVIQRLRKELVYMRKMLWPLRETISSFEGSESAMIQDATRPYIRDLYEHTIQIMDNLELLRDTLTSAFEIYLSMVSNRMNDSMRVLTVIATVFIPLTFVAGIYGMNFEVMPELKWPYGYAYVWALMGAVGIGMLVFFKRKNWL